MADSANNAILIAQHGTVQCLLLPDKANRHGLITGATGTGKTITLQTLAEGFLRRGVPVFMAGSPPPARAATVISRTIRVQILPRFSSWRPFLC